MTQFNFIMHHFRSWKYTLTVTFQISFRARGLKVTKQMHKSSMSIIQSGLNIRFEENAISKKLVGLVSYLFYKQSKINNGSKKLIGTDLAPSHFLKHISYKKMAWHIFSTKTCPPHYEYEWVSILGFTTTYFVSPPNIVIPRRNQNSVERVRPNSHRGGRAR